MHYMAVLECLSHTLQVMMTNLMAAWYGIDSKTTLNTM